MKKLLFIGLAATAMLASCSNDETVEMAQQNAIAFDGFVNKSTRGIDNDITTENIADFGVYGFMESAQGIIFNNEKVYKGGTSTNTEWTYDNTQYWTVGKKYWFSAIAPYTDAKWTYNASNVDGGIITFENDGKQDLLYAKADPIASAVADQHVVEFTFNHLLSRVKFNFSNAMGNDNTTLEVTDVTITNANTKATCDLVSYTTTATDYATWNLANDNQATSFIFGSVLADNARITNEQASATDHLYMIPQNQAYNLTFKVKMYQGTVLAGEYTHGTDNKLITVPIVDMKAGHSYVFNAELNGTNIDPEGELNPIEFTVTDVEKWEEFEKNNVTIPETTQQ